MATFPLPDSEVDFTYRGNLQREVQVLRQDLQELRQVVRNMSQHVDELRRILAYTPRAYPVEMAVAEPIGPP